MRDPPNPQNIVRCKVGGEFGSKIFCCHTCVYINTVSRIKKHPIGKRKLKTVTSDHLQSYMDLLSFGGTDPDGKTVEALSKGSLGQYSAVLQNSFRFAVFPKRLITFNPMQYVVKRIKGDQL